MPDLETIANLVRDIHGRRPRLQPEAMIRILVADRHTLFRQAVRAVLENEKDLEVVAEAGDGREALALAESRNPQVALLDADLPNADGVRSTRLIKEKCPDCRVVVMSSDEDQQVLVAALEAGAHGYLTQGSSLSELIETTRAIHRGDTVVPQHLLGTLLVRLSSAGRRQSEAVMKVTQLTRREQQVLALLADGADKDLIAQELVISPETARTHIQNILGKLGLHSRLEAAMFVIQNRIRDWLTSDET